MIFIPKMPKINILTSNVLARHLLGIFFFFFFTFSSIHILDDFLLHLSRGRTKCLPVSDSEVVTRVRGELCHTAHCHFFVCVSSGHSAHLVADVEVRCEAGCGENTAARSLSAHPTLVFPSKVNSGRRLGNAPPRCADGIAGGGGGRLLLTKCCDCCDFTLSVSSSTTCVWPVFMPVPPAASSRARQGEKKKRVKDAEESIFVLPS